jgi:pentapeptide repeat protein
LLHARELEAHRAQEAALQRYLELMGKLLTDPDRPLHRSSPGDNLSTVARAQTLSILEGLDDPPRKRILLQFLYEAGLINRSKPLVSLIGANLHGAFLYEANLNRADLHRPTCIGRPVQGHPNRGQTDRGFPGRDPPDRCKTDRCRPELCHPGAG